MLSLDVPNDKKIALLGITHFGNCYQIASSSRSPTLIMLLHKNDISRTEKQNFRQGSRIAKLKHHEIYQIVTELKKESKSVPKTLRNMRDSDKLSSQYI